MENIKILWADDEIDLLKPHILFLESKGYKVETTNNGADAIDMVRDENYDIVFLDENMPGISGLETLTQIKSSDPSLPVIMITKSEEETIMEEAIGSKISDYLIKPVNSKQILLSIKKNLDTTRLISETTQVNYQSEFRNIGMRLGDRLDAEEWQELYKKLVYWEMELENLEDEGMKDIFLMQKKEANELFSKFMDENYEDWIQGESDDAPVMSHTLFKKKIEPFVKENTGHPMFVVLIDNLRFDQWKMLKNKLETNFRIEKEDLYYSILPTATQYSRNAIFAGLMPSEIEKRFPTMWKNDDDEGGKNLHEKDFFADLLRRNGHHLKFSYNKITNLSAGRKLSENFNNLLNHDLNVIVYNFVDMLSHARTEMEIIKELADDEAAYRSLTETWFEHSPLLEIMDKIAKAKGKVIITTDHGTIRVQEPSKVIGDRNTNTNLRYKQGKNLNYNAKEVYEVMNPADVFLPKRNVSTRYIFAKEDRFFAYPNNYNYYVGYFKNTFQHGGISLEEVLIPFITLNPK
jgi:CheY-like chemotaxis protein